MSDNEVTPESKPRRRAAGRPAGPPVDAPNDAAEKAPTKAAAKKKAPAAKKVPIAVPVFQSAPVTTAPAKKKAAAKSASSEETLSVAKKGQTKKAPAKKATVSESADSSESASNETSESGEERIGGNNRNRNRNRRGGKNKNRAKSSNGAEGSDQEEGTTEANDEDSADSTESSEAATARKRSRKRTRDGSDNESGSTRLDAKRNRRRDGRDSGRRRAPILTESEFLARRENVERVMVVRQQGARTQIAVLEDGIVVEHYINQSSSGSLVGNVYLGRVQNVLPGMEAAFVDIGKGRNAVLYAGEVNWDAAGLDGQPKKIETALKSGDPVLVQVTKDPVGQKGARLTSQISLPGRFLVYVPNNPMTGISRKLPDRERSRLKTILKAVVPEDAGVIVRTASEGASEEELGRDVARLAAQWTDIEAKSKTASPPTMLYGEPDISIKVVRDIFNEDVKKLIVSGADAWETVEQYVTYVAPDLADRLEKYVGTTDVFTDYRIDEQIAKALDRKVYLPSGGSLVIDRTEAMTVVDVNTGKFIGQGGNLEQTVTKNNMEAAEEIVRQLRLRDIGGIIVIDFIDMVLESNRDQVIRRLIECLGRDRTKHQVAEVTSLGLVQMTRKRIGAGLLEVFSESCDHCQGRGAVVNMEGHDASKTPKNKGKKGNHDHFHDNSSDSTPDSTPEEQVSV
ncbi:MAG: ribonuclease E/G [Actinobacteria bacterium]|nr:ribonuclease E/G [Actinomycetota bacterium]